MSTRSGRAFRGGAEEGQPPEKVARMDEDSVDKDKDEDMDEDTKCDKEVEGIFWGDKIRELRELGDKEEQEVDDEQTRARIQDEKNAAWEKEWRATLTIPGDEWSSHHGLPHEKTEYSKTSQNVWWDTGDEFPQDFWALKYMDEKDCKRFYRDLKEMEHCDLITCSWEILIDKTGGNKGYPWVRGDLFHLWKKVTSGIELMGYELEPVNDEQSEINELKEYYLRKVEKEHMTEEEKDDLIEDLQGKVAEAKDICLDLSQQRRTMEIERVCLDAAQQGDDPPDTPPPSPSVSSISARSPPPSPNMLYADGALEDISWIQSADQENRNPQLPAPPSFLDEETQGLPPLEPEPEKPVSVSTELRKLLDNDDSVDGPENQVDQLQAPDTKALRYVEECQEPDERVREDDEMWGIMNKTGDRGTVFTVRFSLPFQAICVVMNLLMGDELIRAVDGNAERGKFGQEHVGFLINTTKQMTVIAVKKLIKTYIFKAITAIGLSDQERRKFFNPNNIWVKILQYRDFALIKRWLAYVNKDETRIDHPNNGWKKGHFQITEARNSRPSAKLMIEELGLADAEIKWHVDLNLDADTFAKAKNNHIIKRNLTTQKKKRDEARKFLNELYPWQKTLKQAIDTDPDDRSMICVLDPEGGKGKSRFANAMTHAFRDKVINLSNGRGIDMAHTLANAPDVRLIQVVLSRQMQETTNLKFLEQAKDGHFMTAKYQSRNITLETPHIVIYSNYALNWKEVTTDRWRILFLHGNKESRAGYQWYSYKEWEELMKTDPIIRSMFPDSMPEKTPKLNVQTCTAV